MHHMCMETACLHLNKQASWAPSLSHHPSIDTNNNNDAEAESTIIDSYPSEAGLLVGEGSSGEDGLQVHPLALNGVEGLQALSKHCQPLLPHTCLILCADHTQVMPVMSDCLPNR